MTSRCSSCQTPVLWVVTTKGATMPLDTETRDDGNIRMTGRAVRTKHGGGAPEVEYITQDALFPDAGARYVSHFATCPNAATHRKR